MSKLFFDRRRRSGVDDRALAAISYESGLTIANDDTRFVRESLLFAVDAHQRTRDDPIMKPWAQKSLSSFIHKSEVHVHFPFLFSQGCCRAELENLSSSTYDWSRLGVEEQQDEPSQSDLLLVAGWINEQLAEDLKNAYSSLQGRRSVIAVGACAISGGPYTISGRKVIRVADLVPVDIFVPGCPPRPETIIDAIRMLKVKMKPGPDPTTVLYGAIRDTP